MAWLDRRSAGLLVSLVFPLCACDPAEDPGPASEQEDEQISEDGDKDIEEAGCSEQGESRACEFEGEDGVQYCDTIDGALAWGECVGPFACTPGEVQDCGLGEEFGDASDHCSLENGVPAWGCDSGDFEGCACNTPLVLKFDAAPVQMTASPATTFDIDDLGACVTTDWPTTATPWLALDIDKDGTIDSGRELFGSGTRIDGSRRARNGFMALSPLDTDHNGRIDARDERFSELVLWSDDDGDKRGTLAEMEPLSVRSVLSIELDYAVRRSCDERGNCGVERSAFTYVDTTGNIAQGEVVDVHLACQ
ncbi:MAG: calcium-binding protein [Nannocystales bacterium]